MYVLLLLMICFAILLLLWVLWKLDFSRRTTIRHIASTKCNEEDGNVTTTTKHDESQSMDCCRANTNYLSYVSRLPHVPDKQDMDNLYIHFSDFLWFIFFVTPSIVYLAAKGTVILRVRRIIKQIVGMRYDAFVSVWNPELTAGRLMLETSEIVHYVGQTRYEGDNGEGIKAKFVWNEMVLMNNKCEFITAEYVSMEVDLLSKTFIHGEIDGRKMGGREATQILSFHLTGVMHPMIHTFANWGINISHTNNYLRRMAAVTIMYNYTGFTWFPRAVFPFLTSFRLLSTAGESSEISLQSAFCSAWLKGIPNHSLSVNLMPYSDFANFVIKLRKRFLDIVEKYEDFVEIDKEAMFVGTVLHSLDHSMFESIIEDPLWLTLDSTEYSTAGKLAANIRAGFAEDLPGLVFSMRFKDSPHPFFREVYYEAMTINPVFAEVIDTCIIK